jgi:hypothetical protein
MSDKVQDYLRRAAHCENMAKLSNDRDVRLQFADVARQWRALARQTEQLEKHQSQSK